MPISLKANSDGSAEILNGVVSALKINTDGSLEGTTIDGKLDKSENINLGVSVAASGTFVDFVGIPEGVKRITVMFGGVSTNGTSNWLIHVGSSLGFKTSGYVGSCSNQAGTSVVNSNGFLVNITAIATDSMWGNAVISKTGGNATQVNCVGILANGAVGNQRYFGGATTIGETLDRIRITTANGTDQFDAGQINISWEF